MAAKKEQLQPVLPDVPVSDIDSVEDLLSHDEQIQLQIELDTIARQRRKAADFLISDQTTY